MALPAIAVHPEAAAEAKAAHDWYAERSLLAAEAFLLELDAAMAHIAAYAGGLAAVRAWNSPLPASAVSLLRGLSLGPTR
jgi:hypothetical protein